MFKKIELNDVEAMVLLPENYSNENSYPVFIGLSGGEQTPETIQFSIENYFNSAYFKDYIHIVPINSNNLNFKDYAVTEISTFISSIGSIFSVTNSNWAIAGVSNGGKATYNFVAQNPQLYTYVATFPGGIFDTIPNANWSHLKVVLANGKKDGYSWLQESKGTFEKLNNIVSSIEIMVISSQKHIISQDYDIDQIYSKLFQNN